MRLGSDVAVQASLRCSSDLTPSLGTSICHRCGRKKEKKMFLNHILILSFGLEMFLNPHSSTASVQDQVIAFLQSSLLWNISIVFFMRLTFLKKTICFFKKNQKSSHFRLLFVCVCVVGGMFLLEQIQIVHPWPEKLNCSVPHGIRQIWRCTKTICPSWVI